jgi:DNA helicase-2/ATP-dependent DNA helicase PcrA
MLNNNLNSNQEEAVLSTNGPLLVLAGAGTGKTKVLTSRIIHIINSNLASPLEILAVTFTNKAAAEMKKRIGQVVGEVVNNLWISTFHSIAARILRRHPEAVGLKSDFVIIDEDDQIRLLKQIIADFNIDNKQFPAKNYLNKISDFKDKAMNETKLSLSDNNLFLPKLGEVYRTYQYRLKSMNSADFGDLLLYNLEIFNASPDLLSYYQDKFRYILVDEYQDTNNCQYQWLLKLAKGHKNICCVGDDDQSIYSWRGANIANILSFEKDFSDENSKPKIIRLEQNYRSSGNILKVASNIIDNNKQRHGKNLWTKSPPGEKVRLLSFVDDRAEASGIANLIKEKQQQNIKLSHMAVLVRAGYQTRSFEEAFMYNSLPYKVIGGLKFYERMEIKDAIAYLKIAANLDNDLALSRIINVPRRGVGDVSINNLYQKAKSQSISLSWAIKNSIADNSLKGKLKETLQSFILQLEDWRQKLEILSLPEIAKLILNESGYIQSFKNENTLESAGRIENIEEFIRSLEEFSSLTEFLEYVSLIEARDDNFNQDSISIMTVHGAKGLEFDLVFLPGLEDGIFPSAKSVDDKNGLEEERRLLYVAITRAKKELYLTYAQSRYMYGESQIALPSRFLKELPEEQIDFQDCSFLRRSQSSYVPNFNKSANNFGFKKNTFSQSNLSDNKNDNYGKDDGLVGKRVFHQKFGYGKITAIDGAKFEINFDKTGSKTIVKDFVEFV